MASASTTEYKISNLKDIISTISTSYPEYIHKTFIGTGWTVEIYNTIGYDGVIVKRINPSQHEGNSHMFLKSRAEVDPTEIRIYKKYEQYFCNLSHAIITFRDIYRVIPQFINTNYQVSKSHCKITDFGAAKVINIPSHSNISFVFNYEDVRKKTILATLMVFEKLRSDNMPTIQTEVMNDLILPLLGCIKIKGRNTFEMRGAVYDSEYKGEFPSMISKAQLKKLYELGMIKMMTQFKDYTYNYILSDEAYDKGIDGTLKKHFKSKESMHQYIHEILDKLKPKVI